MASLATSLLCPCARASLLRARPRLQMVGLRPASPTRFFASSPLVRAAAPKPAKPLAGAYKAARTRSAPASPTPPDAAAAPTIAPSRYAFIKHLATKPTPTVLYEAPSHFWFYFGCWTTGLTLLGWTALTGPTVVNQPEGVPKWVGVVYGVAYVLIGCMGILIISKTPNLVGSIRVLPVGPGAAAAGAGPRLEVSVKRMLPMLSPRVLTADLSEVALKSRFSTVEEHVSEYKRMEQQRAEQARRVAMHNVDMSRILTMPFRRIWRGVVGMFRGVRASWTGLWLGHIRVDGQEFKVDVSHGYAHDGFRTLERLVKIGWQ